MIFFLPGALRATTELFLMVTEGVEAPKRDWRTSVRCAPEAVGIFSRQLALLISSGVPLSQAMDILSHQPESPNFEAVLTEIGTRLTQGYTLSRLLLAYPRVFSRVYVAMVRVGEETGRLVASLERVSEWEERDERLRKRIRGALTYPLFVLGTAVAMTLGLFSFVLPGFVDIFHSMNIPLPWLTRLMMSLSQGCQNPGNWILGLTGTLALVFMVRQRLRNDPRMAAQVFATCCQIPVLGPMLVASSAARFSAATATLVSAGVRLDRCLKLGALASGNPVVVIDAPLLVDTIHQGERLSEYLSAREDVYPATLSYYVAVGEESSSLPQMLFRAASFFDEELNYRIEALSAALEPVLLAIVATIIGLVLLSVFLPLYGFLDKLGG